MLFIFVPLHTSYSLTRNQIPFQTKDNYYCTNFWLDYYQPNEVRLACTDFRTAWYLVTMVRNPHVTFGSDISSIFTNNLEDYDCIIYTIGLEKSFLRYNYTAKNIFQEINDRNVVYSSGNSLILVKVG